MLNYKQLHYFWRVARDGGITRAAEGLNLTPQTLSGQISLLEHTLGVALFRRVGRRMELTDLGELAYSYADEIFRAGGELEEVLRTSGSGRPLLFRVGLADVLPKSIAYRLLAPAMKEAEALHLVCREDKLPRLMAELAIHRLDLVLSDSPMPVEADVKGYSHKLGECGITVLARPELRSHWPGEFPACLDGAPLLIPGEGTALRGRLLRWLAEHDVRPRIIGEFDDSALMRAFGQGGSGFFPAPSLIVEEVCQQDGVAVTGEATGLLESFYAISVQRRLSHPAVLAIVEAASAGVFNLFPAETDTVGAATTPR